MSMPRNWDLEAEIVESNYLYGVTSNIPFIKKFKINNVPVTLKVYNLNN